MKIRDVPFCGQCRYAIREPSGDHVGSNSMAGEDVSRRTWVPSALIDQMSFVPSESTIRPFKDPMSIRGPAVDAEETDRGAVEEAAAGRDPFASPAGGGLEHAA